MEASAIYRVRLGIDLNQKYSLDFAFQSTEYLLMYKRNWGL